MIKRGVKPVYVVSTVTLGFSALAILGGLLHLTVPVCLPADTFLGVLFLLALAALNLLVYLNDRAVDRDDYQGGRLHRRGYLCLAVIIAGLWAMLLLNLLVAAIYTDRFNGLIFAGIYLCYFGILVLGVIMAWETLVAVKRGFPLQRGRRAKATRKKGGFKKTVTASSYTALVLGLAGLYFLLSGDRSVFFESAPQFAEIFISGFSLFHAFSLLSVVVLILKLQNRPGSAGAALVGALGLVSFALYLLPLAGMFQTCAAAKTEFEDVFGSGRLEQVDADRTAQFLDKPFSLPAYFLGMRPGEYRYEKDLVFYEGSGGVDDGLKLYCDVFMPPEGRTDLPGWGSTLIRIHGGAWIGGDKGFANMLQVNKYFASQGYTVFDLQYGLTDLVELTVPALQAHLGPPGLIGPYTLDDMIRHLGEFTKYMAAHAAAYDLDLDSVFITGGSAGGQLSTALALAISGENHPELFSDAIKVKGYIPLYPAIETSFLPDIGEAPEWIDVKLLVDEKSPPCLVYQGTKDGMVKLVTARELRETYRAAGNEECALLEFGWGGHASDFYFPGYFNQAWTYYMERFMYLHR